ncbi:D-galactarate dehydratase [Tropicimonas sp. IMCC34011]|uniref:D-galactarate dehydratase n=1 Tax=Tropicimonas sp. IMCC34011 TaxID=2248759 RepID=UPI000E222711|nr:D-galactarate dehydratase [Tropicimonas sp. IMCC34011]
MQKTLILAFLAATAITAGCAKETSVTAAAPDQPPASEEQGTSVGAGTAAAPPPARATTVDEFDTTSEEERAAAKAPPEAEESGSSSLGTTIASLGDPTEPGFWLETPLVSGVRQGRIEYQGESVKVELRPSGGESGSGSRISLPAMRLIGAGLTDLPEIAVFAL